MAPHPGLHALAAAITAAVLIARWAATRPPRDRRGASAARPPWRRMAPEASEGPTLNARVGEVGGLPEGQVWLEVDEHLERCWNELTSLYPQDGGERGSG
ncbi:hypothetical protein ACFWC9_38515 [Streptomyces goshikiensis]|uniref:hypothetical protein n=1 Tax=Streptomyces goshikiensis TaxID=1942 RepID=UPI00368F3602